MIMKKTNQLKKVSYFCLTILSAAVPSTLNAMESHSREYFDHSERYPEGHNRMVEKYSKENPDLLRHKIPIEPRVKEPSLTEVTGDFLKNTKIINEKFKKENEDLGKVGEKAVKGVSYLAKEGIDSKVKDPEAKSFFLGLVDSAKEKALSFFKE
ncbi:MAG: hypothetical protein K2Y18_04405 [Alphaproteobacteria bacterium]|jgi:hypothetical protein|nr:hypothetical protein [Alphaproteobacteria bacterium]